MKRKDQILHTATTLFASRGYSHLSMAELAKLTGVAQGTIFYHFNSKEHLFQIILERFKAELTEAFGACGDDSEYGDGLEALIGRVKAYFDIVGKMEEQFLLLHRHDAYEIASDNPECLKLLEGIYSDIIRFFETAIVAGQKDGSIASRPAGKSAMIVFTMVDGLVRLNTYGIYQAGALYEDFIDSVCRVVANTTSSQPKGAPCR